MANQLTRRGFLYSAALMGGTLLQGRSPLSGREQWIQTPEELKLWYRSPASEWVEALPIGNGRLGALFGMASAIGFVAVLTVISGVLVILRMPETPAVPVAAGHLHHLRQKAKSGRTTEQWPMADGGAQHVGPRGDPRMSFGTILSLRPFRDSRN